MNNLLTIISVILFTFSFNYAQAQINQGTVTVGSGSNQMDMTITVNNPNSTVEISLSGPSTKWFGFGFATSSMGTGAYTILGNVASATPKEYNQMNHAAPSLQSTQNLANFTTNTSGGITTYTFTRPITTGDNNDFTFPSTTGSISLIWAYGSSTSMGIHSNRGTASINLTSICNIPVTVLPTLSVCQGDSAMIFGNYQHQANTYTNILTAANGCDSTISQTLVVNQPYAVQLADTSICLGDSIQLFGSWIKQGGTYIDSLLSMNGCDSINTIMVNTVIADTNVFVDATGLYANAFSTSYQWYDCATNLAIAGATTHDFHPTANGMYKVEVTVANCIKMSNCHGYYSVGINAINTQAIRLAPNPVDNNLSIELPTAETNYTFIIYAIDGREIMNSTMPSGSNQLELSGLESGMYIYQISNQSQNVKAGRFIKK
jgi:hypothetical protein